MWNFGTNMIHLAFLLLAGQEWDLLELAGLLLASQVVNVPCPLDSRGNIGQHVLPGEGKLVLFSLEHLWRYIQLFLLCR